MGGEREKAGKRIERESESEKEGKARKKASFPRPFIYSAAFSLRLVVAAGFELRLSFLFLSLKPLDFFV